MHDTKSIWAKYRTNLLLGCIIGRWLGGRGWGQTVLSTNATRQQRQGCAVGAGRRVGAGVDAGDAAGFIADSSNVKDGLLQWRR